MARGGYPCLAALPSGRREEEIVRPHDWPAFPVEFAAGAAILA